MGPLVAQRLGWKFVDVDDVIETETGTKIASLFATEGEVAFRDREHATIARLTADDEMVMALGGGAIERPETRNLLLAASDTLLVHLEVKLATTLARWVQGDRNIPVQCWPTKRIFKSGISADFHSIGVPTPPSQWTP